MPNSVIVFKLATQIYLRGFLLNLVCPSQNVYFHTWNHFVESTSSFTISMDTTGMFYSTTNDEHELIIEAENYIKLSL